MRYATAFNAMGVDLAMKIANKNNIALMLIVQNKKQIGYHIFKQMV